MEIERVLVALDFSPQADVALEHAARIARRTGARLTLLHAIPALIPDPPAELEALRERVAASGVETAVRVETADPADAIIDVSAELRSDLIVVGTHGRTGFSRLLLGSVAERVVRGARTSVMVARDGRERADFARILVPTDFSEQAEAALRTALLLAGDGATIELFHCWLPPAAMPVTGGVLPAPGPVIAPTDFARESRDNGAALIDRYRTDRVELAFSQDEQPAVRGIQRHLDEGDYDCVVLGSHGRRGLRRWLLGSVAEPTVRYAPCTAVVVRAS